MAGVDWLYGYMARHPELALRKPESTSFLRSMGFNKEKVENFFAYYLSLLETFKFNYL